MMVLAIDTTSEHGGLAIYRDLDCLQIFGTRVQPDFRSRCFKCWIARWVTQGQSSPGLHSACVTLIFSRWPMARDHLREFARALPPPRVGPRRSGVPPRASRFSQPWRMKANLKLNGRLRLWTRAAANFISAFFGAIPTVALSNRMEKALS